MISGARNLFRRSVRTAKPSRSGWRAYVFSPGRDVALQWTANRPGSQRVVWSRGVGLFQEPRGLPTRCGRGLSAVRSLALRPR